MIIKGVIPVKDHSPAQFVAFVSCDQVHLKLTCDVISIILRLKIRLLIRSIAKKICLQKMYLETMVNKEKEL